jgi:hypothetical protein
MITIQPIASYYNDDEKAVIARKADLTAAGKRRRSELAAIDAEMMNQIDTDTLPEDQIQNLIAGIEVARPQPLSAQRTELQYIIRDIEQALEFMADKERQLNVKAGARLAKDIKPHVDKAEKELADALVIASAKHLVCWHAKRHLINSGIGLHGLFDSNVDDVLGIPVGHGAPLSTYFYSAVKSGHLKSVPESLR